MKKLLNIFTDAFLFLFLLTILVVPVLVSFNLDPQVYEPKEPVVAGVRDDRTHDSSDLSFDVEERMDSSDDISVKDIIFQNGVYRLEFENLPSDKNEAYFKLGSVINLKTEREIFRLKLSSQKPLPNEYKALVQIDNREYTLVEDNNFSEVVFDIGPGGSSEILLEIYPDMLVEEKVELNLEIYTN